jgi:DNA mismatch endonuclease (patch repair protein)
LPDSRDEGGVERKLLGREIGANCERDRRQGESLDRAGWRTVRVWEHEDVEDAADRVIRALGDGHRHDTARGLEGIEQG